MESSAYELRLGRCMVNVYCFWMQELTHNLRDDGDIGPKSLEIQFARQDTVIVYISFRQNAAQK